MLSNPFGVSAGLLRVKEEGVGEVLGGLYSSNSIGAAAGALLTTFMLLPLLGMPGTVMMAGLLNIVVALVAWTVWKMVAARPEQAAPQTPRAAISATG